MSSAAARARRRRQQERADVEFLHRIEREQLARGIPPEAIPCAHCRRPRIVQELHIWEHLAMDPEERWLVPAIRPLRAYAQQDDLVAFCADCGCFALALDHHH